MPLVLIDSEDLRMMIREELKIAVAPATATGRITQAEACRLTGISPKTFKKLRETGSVQYTMLGKSVMYHRSEIETMTKLRHTEKTETR